jgi:hypothetical protein
MSNSPKQRDENAISQKLARTSGSNSLRNILGDDLDWAKQENLLGEHLDAVQGVAEHFGLDLEPERVKTLVRGLSLHKLTKRQTVNAVRLLLHDTDFKEGLRYGATLQALDFVIVLPEDGAYYTERQVDRFDRLTDYEKSVDFHKVGGPGERDWIFDAPNTP